jgi:hypothetical protein
MDDKQILHRIGDLVDEEHRLRGRHSSGDGLSESERSRLRELEESLDQCWDLLRRRRAARDVGGDPGAATARSVNEVEGYLQ